MAGDWIKMRVDLHLDPAVIAVAAATGLDEDTVVGKLHRLWSWANGQTLDGNAAGVTLAWVDRYLGVTGVAQALLQVGWLAATEGGIQIPKFDIHNSESAKRRALTALRASKHRSNADRNANRNAARNAGGVTKCAPREEKRREENTPLPPKGGGDEFAGKTQEEAAADLAAQWCFRSTRRVRGVQQDMPVDLLPSFGEMLRLGHSADDLLAAILDPARDRNEYFWQFQKRLGNPALSPAEEQRRAVERQQEEDRLSRLNDPNTASTEPLFARKQGGEA